VNLRKSIKSRFLRLVAGDIAVPFTVAVAMTIVLDSFC
jgi:hypothetical protein